MPSTLVHLAVAGLLAAALLADEFDARALAVVFAVTIVVDLDSFLGLVVPGAHRAAFHTLLLPALLALGLAVDDRRDEPLVRGRWGSRGVRVAWVSTAALLFAAIGPDLFTNGVNVLWPVHDAFYEVNGRLFLSDQRGLVQTFVEVSSDPIGTTNDTFYRTGVDPAAPGESDANAERIFPVVGSGWQLLLLVLGTATVTARLWEERS